MTRTRTCTACSTEKALTEFSKSATGKYGHRSSCKVCESARAVAWAKNNKAKKRDALRRYYAKNASKFQTYAGVKAWAKRLLKNAASSSKARALGPPSIDEAWILEQPMLCPYLGIALTPSVKKSLWQPSLDRIDNSRGYTPDNTRLTSLAWNLLRNDVSIEHALSLVSHLRAEKSAIE